MVPGTPFSEGTNSHALDSFPSPFTFETFTEPARAAYFVCIWSYSRRAPSSVSNSTVFTVT